MLGIIKASLYKLIKDRPFKIMMIICTVLAILFTLLYCLVIPELNAGGYFMLKMSSSPTNNFGLAVPIYLVTFIIGEFNYGTIRNKIIAGNKKINIYIALFIMAVIFTLSLMTVYIGVSVLLGSILRGFIPDGGTVEAGEVVASVFEVIITYVMLSALAVFVASSIRHIGGSVAITVVSIMGLFVVGLISMAFSLTQQNPVVPDFLFLVNPIMVHVVLSDSFGIMSALVSNVTRALVFGIISNAIYTVLFTIGGILIFNYRDVK